MYSLRAAKIFFCLLGFCLSHSLLGQILTVLEIGSNEPIADVYVYSSDKTFTGSTNAAGALSLNDLPAPFTLHLQHPSFEDEVYTSEQLQGSYHNVFLVKSENALPEYTINANRVRESYDEVSNDLDLIDPKEIILKQAANSGDLLTSSGKVYLQKSQLGGGSPVLRGLEANKVLLVVDGVRMNNAIYRSGHLQNVLTIDHSIIDQVEVIFGPGSLVYGNDALGGTMHFHTKDPQFSEDQNLLAKVNLSGNFNSAFEGFSEHVDVSLGSEKIAYLFSFSHHSFGDLKIGTRRSHGDQTWGLQPNYVTQNEDGEDLIVANNDPATLRGTGYTQYDLLQKLRIRLADRLEWFTNVQFSNSSNIPRYDRLNDLEDDDTLRFAEWNYGPQKRLLVLTGLHVYRKNRFFDELHVGLSYQDIEEQRFNRRTFSESRNERTEDLNVYTINADLQKELGEKSKLQYGIEFNRNNLVSTAFTSNVLNELIPTTALDTRYPNGENYTTSLGAYLRHKFKASERLSLSQGLRINNDQLSSSFVEDEVSTPAFDEISYDNYGLTFNLGMNYHPNKGQRITASVGSGYRNPNIDDIGKTFAFEEDKVVLPNADVSAEQAYTADIALFQEVKEIFQVELSAYYTYLNDAIRRVETDDVFTYEGVESTVFVNSNVGEARIFGGALNMQVKFAKDFKLEGSVTYTDGKDISNDSPLGHIPPLFGKFGLTWTKEKFTLRLVDEWNAEKPLDKYSESSEDKLNEALATGTPSWNVIHFNALYQPSEHFTITAGLENILDEHYLPFSSGISAAGRNFKLGLGLHF